VLQFASIGFDVSSQEIFSTLLDGGMLYMIDRETKTMVPQLLDFIGKRALETLYLPPALLKFIFSHHEYMEKFPRSVKHIIAAGEQLIVTDGLRNHMAKNNVYLHNHYGPAETHVVTAFTLAPRDSVDEKPPIGKPIANTAIYLLDPNHNPLPIGIPGELYISSLNVSRGYCNQPELTAEKFLDDPFCQSQPGHHMYRTGDLARWLAQGNIEFLGRMDNQVKIRGFRIEPAEVEAKLLNHREIEDAAVVARDDAGTLELGGGNKYLCAYIVCKGNVEIADLRDYLSIELPDYMIPSYFVYLTEIPLTPNKKVNTRKLPEPKIVSKQGSSLPRDEIDKKVASMWWEILELENTIIGIDTNFFQLGGQSLKATLLLQKIHKEFNVRMTLGEMFKAPTIKGMSTYIKGAIKTSFSPVELAERKEYYHLSSAQKRLYVLQQMELTKTTYNLPINVVLKGKLEKLKLEGTFRALIARHESLRTSFAPVAETPIQLIHDEVAFKVDYYEAKTEKEGKNKVNHLIIPFQLSRAPLLRVGLIEIEENTHILLIDMHHIVADSISQDILVQEFIALYHDRRLPHLKFQYKDYSQWQNGKKAKDILEQQETYWLKTFQGQIPALNLPTDYLRPAIQSFAGSNIGFVIGGEQTKKLKVLAWQEGATLYMTILALYYVFLAKISGQEDIVVGTPVSGRQHSDLDPIVGMFVNTLALRNYPGPEETFAHFLQEVKQQLLEALENQDYPFEELVDKLKITRDTGRNPLFDVMFTFQPQLEYKSTLPEDTALKIALFKSENPTAKFDMALNAVEDEHALHFNIEYSTKLFKKETIDRFAAYFKDIVTTVANNRNVKLKDIEISLELTDSKSTISHEAQGAFEF
jgi:non-ribosomal peptide synthetase component F/acyl carrier protein